MKRKLIYFIALLVILAGVAVPAFYMHKVFSSQQQYKQVESSKTNDYGAKEQNNAVGRGQPAGGTGKTSLEKSQTSSGTGQASPGADKDRPVTEAKQDSTVSNQKNSTLGSASRESTAPLRVSNNSAPAVAPGSGCKVWIAVVGKNGEFLYRAGPVMVKKDNKWGITAMGALDAAGISYSTLPAWPDFVGSIGGQANSGVAGWMYSVNGEISMHMADKNPVKTGDKVIWWYSKSMDQPPPQWEDLVKKK